MTKQSDPRQTDSCWIAITILFLLAAMGNSAASGQQPLSNARQIEFFEQRIRPLLVEHCYECHSGEEQSGGLSVASRSRLLVGGDTGPAIVAGQPAQSLLIHAVRYTSEDLQMPPQNRLLPSQVKDLERWIEMGAPDPRQTTDETKIEPTGMTLAEGKQFWSFQPIANPDIPVVHDSAWSANPIDAFILSQLESVGIRPAAPASRHELIRRVTFDLIGLPPTPVQIDEFVNDDSADAYERLIARLLTSPQYGVRWGRHWLDVARYADSNGLDENLAFGNAWRYRDYVINAFNQDKPFDRFLIEQIAGDLLPGANRETKTATGFLVLGAKVLAEPDREKLMMDSIDEQIDSMGKAFLGMTFGCVRCHDHKFDPITQADYYSLAAIFKSTKTFGDTNTGAIKHWHEHSFASAAQLAAIAKVDATIAKQRSAASSFKSKTITAIRTEARGKATEYLVAATQLEPTSALTDVAKIAAEYQLHPRILHHCRLHLHYHQDDLVFSDWHRLSSSSRDRFPETAVADAVADHYRPLFAEAESALQRAKAENPQATTLKDARLEAIRAALYDPSGFLAVPAKPEFALNPSQLATYYQLMETARITESNAPDADSVMGVVDGAILDRLPIHIRGNHRSFGREVTREFPAVMRQSSARPVFPSNQSGRLQLARWMASTTHPLTARVYANRIWRWHFGRGLVATTENFGVLGDRPSHPKLLDWLARQLMESGWSTKKLHWLILTSRVYRMSAVNDHALADQIDPANRLLWKFPLQRMNAEQIRDAILMVAGRLDHSPLDGKTVPLRNRQFVFNHTSVDHTKYDSLRRAAFLPVIRNNLYSLFAQFDFPDPTMPTGNRATTIVAPQSLWLMNSDLVIDCSHEMARRLIKSVSGRRDRVRRAYRLTLGREPTRTEINRADRYIDRWTSGELTGSDSIDPIATEHAWAAFCQSLLASNEFIYLR